MKLVHSKTPLPRKWNLEENGIVLKSDIFITPRARLHAKLLVFDKSMSMRKFWKKYINDFDLGKSCLGVVNQLAIHHMKFEKDGTEKNWIEADPRYYCVIGLINGRITTEIVIHEAIHAAFAYAKRVKKTPWYQEAKRFDEEEICYPAGRIADVIFRILKQENIKID